VVSAVLVILLVPVTVALYKHSTVQKVQKQTVSESKQASGGGDMTSSTGSSELRQMQNTVEKMKQYPNPPQMSISLDKTYVAVLKTSLGSMDVVLDQKTAPVTANNFIFLAREGFYDKTVFHRVISGFMIQGGDPEGTGRGGPGYAFADEPITRDYVRGAIAMANRGPDTNGSQFFIMHRDYDLPKNYVIFGRIAADDAKSLETLDKIASQEVTGSDSGELSKPVQPVMVESVIIKEL
jgi:cyclophilin family peptidyl-prolyl cis-trans isomerase